MRKHLKRFEIVIAARQLNHEHYTRSSHSLEYGLGSLSSRQGCGCGHAVGFNIEPVIICDNCIQVSRREDGECPTSLRFADLEKPRQLVSMARVWWASVAGELEASLLCKLRTTNLRLIFLYCQACSLLPCRSSMASTADCLSESFEWRPGIA